MNLDNVLELQAKVRRKVDVLGLVHTVKKTARAVFRLPDPGDMLEVSIGVGINWERMNDYRLAIRFRSGERYYQDFLEGVLKLAKGEVDALVTGPVRIIGGCDGRPPLGPQPLSIGASIGHKESLGGTLGFFAHRISDKKVGIVSANHVIALQDKGVDGNPVVHPSLCDGGNQPVAQLDGSYPRLHQPPFPKTLDCAFAVLNDQSAGDRSTLLGGGTLNGTVAPPQADTTVFKIGRTTGRTKGRLKAFRFDRVTVHDYENGPVHFVNQIEIESTPGQAFANPGDSGSLVFNSSNQPVGLLFAEAANLHYANPISAVIESLKVTPA